MNPYAIPTTLAVLLSATLLTPEARTQAMPVQEFTPAAVSGEYGVAVALEGDVAAVGARTEDGLVNAEGAAYVWKHDGIQWVLDEKVFAFDGALFDYFGNSVAIVDDVLVVGAPYDDDLGPTSGSVYIYREKGAGWTLERKLTEPSAGSLFGWQVALHDNVLLVQGSDQVLVYRYINQIIGWQLDDTIPVDSNELSFDVTDDRFVIGQGAEDGVTTGDGVVWVYDHDGSDWVQTQVLMASDADSGDLFGRDVAVDGDVIAVGATRDGGTGSLYLFELDTGVWVESARLLPGNGVGGEFGEQVDVSGFAAVVVSRSEEYGYEFRKEKGVWAETAVLGSPIADIGFARSVAVDGDRAILGSMSGHAYEYPAGSLRLSIDPLTPIAGDLITIKTHTGIPNNPALLFVVNVNGSPFFIPLAVYEFGNDYAFTIQSFVPAGLAGLEVTFESFGIGVSGKLQPSNLVTVQFQ